MSRPKSISPDQEKVLLITIEQHQTRHGYPPSIREIADQMNFHYTNVGRYLDDLEKRGYLHTKICLQSRQRRLTLKAYNEVVFNANFSLPIVAAWSDFIAKESEPRVHSLTGRHQP